MRRRLAPWLYFLPFVCGFCCRFGFSFWVQQKNTVDIVSTFHPSLTTGALTYLLLVSPCCIVPHCTHPDRSWSPIHLQHCVFAFCWVCCSGCVHDHKCAGSAQVCLLSFLVRMCVSQGFGMVGPTLKLTQSRGSTSFVPYSILHNFFPDAQLQKS